MEKTGPRASNKHRRMNAVHFYLKNVFPSRSLCLRYVVPLFIFPSTVVDCRHYRVHKVVFSVINTHESHVANTQGSQ